MTIRWGTRMSSRKARSERRNGRSTHLLAWRFCTTLAVLLAARASADEWELRRDDLSGDRPVVQQGVVDIDLSGERPRFPRYLNELGVKAIRIRFTAAGGRQNRVSIVWTGGTRGPDKFAVKADGTLVGASRVIDTARRPGMWYREEFDLRLKVGSEHCLEISSPQGYGSAIEFAGIRMSAPDADGYQPLCYESIGSLERYEQQLGGKGTIAKSAHLWVFAPRKDASTAKRLARFLEKAYAEMKCVYGIDTIFKFSVEHYPPGHKRGWGGISGAGTIGYTTEALTRFARLGTQDVRGFVGYTEEMSHGFKAYYKCDGTYEALGVAVQEQIVRKLVSRRVADAYWLPEHKRWHQTHQAYLAAGRTNPDPREYPWNVLFTRILNSLFLKLGNEYRGDMWRDFFKAIRDLDYPLHRAKKTERMRVYADIFSNIFKRDMRAEFTAWGIDLEADPPWGWQTSRKP